MGQILKIQADVGRITVPNGKDETVVYDSARDRVRGLALRLRKGGIPRWLLIYRDAEGKQRRHVIGDANVSAEDRPDCFTLSQARKEALKAREDINEGRDPAAAREARKAKIVADRPLAFGALVETYLEARAPDSPIAKKRMRERSHVECARHLRVHLKALHSLPIASVETIHIYGELERLAKDGYAATADKVRSTASAFYTWLAQTGQYRGVNPVAGMATLAEYEPRERVLSDAEMAAVWNAADPATDYGRIVRLLLLTGCRREEIGGLRWSEVDLEARTISLPGERTKNGAAHVAPLSDAAIAILSERKAFLDRQGRTRECVFGTPDNGFSAWSKNKTKLDETSGVSGWTLHDLRRTLRTGLSALGTQPHVAEAVLNHLPTALSRTYDRHQYLAEKAAALAAWASHVAVILAQASGANVTKLPARKA